MQSVRWLLPLLDFTLRYRTSRRSSLIYRDWGHLEYNMYSIWYCYISPNAMICEDYVRIVIAIFVTLDHVHFGNEMLFLHCSRFVDRGCLPVLAETYPSHTHHPIIFMIFASGNLFSLARWASWSPYRRSWSRHPISAWTRMSSARRHRGYEKNALERINQLVDPYSRG